MEPEVYYKKKWQISKTIRAEIPFSNVCDITQSLSPQSDCILYGPINSVQSSYRGESNKVLVHFAFWIVLDMLQLSKQFFSLT